MNRLIRRAFGAIAVVIGVLGVLLSGAAVAGAWVLADRMGTEVPAAVTDLERLVASVQRQGDSTIGLIDAARERVRFVGQTVEELSGPGGEDRGASDASTILQAIDPEIERRLESAEAFILAMQDSLRSLNRALVMLDAFPLLSRRSAADDRPFASVAGSMAEAAELLDEAMLTLRRIRAGQALSPRQLDQFQDLLGEVDRSLADVRSQVDTFFDGLDRAVARLSGIRSASTTWIDRAAAASSCFFVCFGASQVSLIALGWILMTRRDSPIGPA